MFSNLYTHVFFHIVVLGAAVQFEVGDVHPSIGFVRGDVGTPMYGRLCLSCILGGNSMELEVYEGDPFIDILYVILYVYVYLHPILDYILQ